MSNNKVFLLNYRPLYQEKENKRYWKTPNLSIADESMTKKNCAMTQKYKIYKTAAFTFEL